MEALFACYTYILTVIIIYTVLLLLITDSLDETFAAGVNLQKLCLFSPV